MPLCWKSHVTAHILWGSWTLYLPVLSAVNLCRQLGPRSGPGKHQASSGSKLFDTDGIPEIVFEKVNFANKKACKISQHFKDWNGFLGRFIKIWLYTRSKLHLQVCFDCPNSLPPENFFVLFCLPLIFFKNNFFEFFFSGIPSVSNRLAGHQSVNYYFYFSTKTLRRFFWVPNWWISK